MNGYQVNRSNINFKLFCLTLVLSFASISAFTFPATMPTQVPSHTILFDEIGQMASSMTYIHIAIPLNISTFTHQINVFNSYLENFINIKTNKQDQILLTKAIRDLANFADSRLLTLAEKVKYIDHLLPKDTSGFANRQKRFFFIAPYFTCQDDLHFERERADYELQAMRGKYWDAKLLHKQCEEERNAYPDHDEFHDVYYNDTYPATTTTTPPPKVFRAFLNYSKPYYEYSASTYKAKPKPQPEFTEFDNFFHKFNASEISINPNSTENFFHIIKATSPPRHKRQLLAGAALLSGVVGTFFGLYNTYQIHNIQKQLLDITDQQNLLTSISLKHEHIIHDLTTDLTHLTDIVRTLIKYNPALVYAKLQQNVQQIEDRLTILFNTLQQLQTHRLAVNLLDEHQMQVLQKSVKATADSKGLELIPKQPTDFFQLDTSYIRMDNDILILLHVPCLTSNHMLTIYRYVPFPYPVDTPDIKSKDPHPPIHNTNDILARTTRTRSSMFFVPETELIAVGRNTNSNIARYQLVSQAILAGCIQTNHVFLCDKHQVLRKNLEGSCLGALFIQHQQGVMEQCKIEYRPNVETVYQLSTNNHLVYSPNPLTTQILCTNGSHYPQQLVEITKIHVPDHCSIDLINHTITSDGNIQISPKPLQMFMTLDTNIFPSEMMNAIEHADDEMNQIKISIDQIKKNFTSDEIFNQMLISNLSTPNTVSIVLWTLSTLSFLGYLIFFCWYCNALRYRRSSNRRNRRRKQTDEEAGIPLNQVDAPVRFDDEDEISFIARTGHVTAPSLTRNPPPKHPGRR